MKYTVLWTPEAEAHLAELWLSASDQQVVANAADSLDFLLARSPSEQGESREGLSRLAFFEPLAAFFSISENDRIVYVERIWRIK